MPLPPTTADELAQCLLAVARHRDKAAFARLFGHFAPRLAAFHIRGGLGIEEAEELAQETMARVWHKADQYDPARAGISTWIFTIARNQRIDHLRRSSRALEASAFYGPDEQPEPSAEDLALCGERESQVRTALTDLSEAQAQVVRLSFFAEKPHAEIARELGIPLGTVKSRLRLAMQRIRERLGDLR